MYFREVADTKRLFVLVVIMIGVAVASAGIGGWGLYQAALDEQKNWLRELVQTQARMIEAVARFDAEFSQNDYPGGAASATISQVLDAHNSATGFGMSGEFVLARQDGDNIVFLEAGRRKGGDAPAPVPFSEHVAQPMHHALLGKSGVMIGLDYRRVSVLAAYEPVAVLNIGIVAKMDMSEIRAPFVRVAIIGGLGTLFVVILGAVLTLRISAPFVSALQLQAQMLDNMSEGVHLIRSEDATIVSTNPKLEAMFGYAPGELIGKNVSILNANNDSAPEDTARDIITTLKETGHWSGEVHNVRKDGTPFWCHASVSAFNHPEFGDVWVSAHEDISARKEIQNVSMRLGRIIEQSKNEVYIFSAETLRFSQANRGARENLGYDQSELNTMTPLSIKPNMTAEAFSALIDPLRDGSQESVTFQTVHQRKDGTTYDVEVFLQYMAHEQPPIFVAIILDISDRKQAETALQKSEQRFRAIADYTYAWEIWLGVDGDVKWVNPAVERMTGYPVRECLKMAQFPLEIVHEDDRVSMTENRSESLYEGMESDIDARVLCKNGDLLWASFSYQPIYDDDDAFLGSRWSIHDIGARKRLESDLLHAKSDAEKANNAKSEFLAGMSHDLRTPLNAIMGFSDMMRSKTFGPLGDAHYEAYADDIYNSGDLLVSLINDILDLSKVEAGKYDLVEDSLDVAALVEGSFKQVQNMAEQAELSLSSDFAPNLPHLCGDKKVLSQILNNLLSNAIKFTPAGGAVSVAARLDGDGGFVISVADEGIGMSEIDIAKSMQPFEQVSGKNAREHDGTGLGLPLCANFMALHDGEIAVESAVGKGTTVTVRFPPDRTILS